jgi:hypothetical protein
LTAVKRSVKVRFQRVVQRCLGYGARVTSSEEIRRKATNVRDDGRTAVLDNRAVERGRHSPAVVAYNTRVAHANSRVTPDSL